MNGENNKTTTVMCCFTGSWIEPDDAIELKITLPGDNTETQTLFAKKSAFRDLICDKVPLHPDLLDD